MPLPRWPRRSLRTYLVGIILAATVPLALVLASEIASEARLQREVLLAGLAGTARAVSVTVDREVQASIDVLHSFSYDQSLGRGDASGFRAGRRQTGTLRPTWHQLLLLRDDGAPPVLIDSRDADPSQPTALLARLSALRAPEDSQPFVSGLEGADRRGGTWIAVPMKGPNDARYWLAALVRPDAWQSLLESLLPDQGMYVALFDSRRRVVAATAERQAYVGTRLPETAIAAVASNPSGVQLADMLGGGRTYVAWRLLPHGWGVGVGVAAAPFDAMHRSTLWWTVLTAAACLILGVTAAHLLSRRIARPLAALLRHGPVYDAPIEVNEIAQLRDAFEQSERDRSAAADSLARKASDFEALFKSSPIGLAYTGDAGCSEVVRNARMESLMPVAGPHRDVVVWHAGQPVPAAEQPLARAARTGIEVPALELEIRQPDAPARHVLATATPLLDSQGRTRGAIGAATDVTEAKLAECERHASFLREQAARHEAEQANRAKDEFLSMLGHELRNPLNAIVTSVEVLRRAPPDDPVAHSARAVVMRQTNKLVAMVDQLLDVGHVMADEVELLKQPVDLAEITAAGIASVEARAAARHHQLRVGPLAAAWVDADANRLAQVVGHLLDNAIKYTPEGGSIAVDVATHGGSAVLRVVDDGPGIDADLLRTMFQPFVQGARRLDRQAGGFGIGLALVQRLVQLHGGTVTAVSSASGSTFEVRLPLTQPPQGDIAAGAAARAGRIGVIDDNPDALASMRAMLELAGYRVRTAPDGVAGVALLLADAPDIAIVDIGLPGLDGYEVARRSRAGGFRGRLIALSGYGQKHDMERSQAEGFEAHLVKPVKLDQLLPLLAAA